MYPSAAAQHRSPTRLPMRSSTSSCHRFMKPSTNVRFAFAGTVGDDNSTSSTREAVAWCAISMSSSIVSDCKL